MNRTDEIRSTLGRAEQAEDLTPDADADWRAHYRDHVAYLLGVVASYGPSLEARLREQSRQLADLRRTVRHQRWAIISLSTILVFGALVGLATVRSEAASRSTTMPGPVTTLPIRVEPGGAPPLGAYCTEWVSTGRHCAGGCIWERWCTDCIPGCEWYLDQKCRPTPGAICPFYAAGTSPREGPLADP